MSRRLAFSLGLRLVAVCLLTAMGARAEDGALSSRRAVFRADRVELEPGQERLELDGGVTVLVDRYRLTSEHLSLERGPRGIIVRGSGRVALCPCPDPPVTF